jgi:hypothetical protein
VEREQLIRRQGAEAEKAEPTQLHFEPARMDVQTLLTGLPLAPDPVVVEDDIGTSREPVPFPGGRDGADAGPKGDVERKVHESATGEHEGSFRSEAAYGPANDASAAVRVEEGAELHLGQERRVDPHQLNRRGSARMTQTEASRRVRQKLWRTPGDVDAAATQPYRHGFGLRGALGQ